MAPRPPVSLISYSRPWVKAKRLPSTRVRRSRQVHRPTRSSKPSEASRSVKRSRENYFLSGLRTAWPITNSGRCASALSLWGSTNFWLLSSVGLTSAELPSGKWRASCAGWCRDCWRNMVLRRIRLGTPARPFLARRRLEVPTNCRMTFLSRRRLLNVLIGCSASVSRGIV